MALILSTFLLNAEMKPHIYHHFSAGLHSVSPTCSRRRADVWCMGGCRQALTMEFLPSRHFMTPTGKYLRLKSFFLCHSTHTGNVQPPTHPHTLLPETWICNPYPLLYYWCYQQFNTIEIIYFCMRSYSKLEENDLNYIFIKKCWSRTCSNSWKI